MDLSFCYILWKGHNYIRKSIAISAIDFIYWFAVHSRPELNIKVVRNMDYKGAYLHLFNKVTDTIEILKSAQAKAEDITIAEENTVIELADLKEDDLE